MKSRRLALRVCAVILVSASAGIASGQSALQLLNAPRLKPGPPVTFGTSQESFYTVPEWEFDPAASTETYDDFANGGLNALRFATGGGTGFLGGPHLPDGAVLTSITFDLCDGNTTDHHITAGLESCASVDGLCAILGTPSVTTSNAVTPCAAYTQDLSGLNFTVSNQTSRLVLVVVPGAADNTNAFAGATLGYKLQVSPAPGTATFGDVPTSHPFFQYVEALAKSGITGGCGSGNYCPDAPVTRGQMAVFLAKGLGLQFP